jgi:hypothetical protein
MVLVVVSLSAQHRHFVQASAQLNSDTGQLTVSFKEAGLGESVLINYTASADATATYHCVNNGGQCPNAANKQTVQGPVSGSGAFASGKNGQVTASLTIDPRAATLWLLKTPKLSGRYGLASPASTLVP